MVIEAPLESMLVVAAAGSGKTETMAARVVWLVANGLISLEQVLGLTFTRKAASELADRVAGRLRRLADALPGRWDPLLPVPDILTYHAYAGRLLGEHGLRIGVEPGTRLLTEASSWQYAHEVVQRYDGPMAHVEAAASTVTRAVVAVSAELNEHLQSVEAVEEYLGEMETRVASLPGGGFRGRGLPADVVALVSRALARRELLPLVTAYQRLKRQRRAMDFADQMAFACRLVAGHPVVVSQERGRRRVVLLDEVQDTSEAQLTLLHALFAARDAAAPDAAAPAGSVGPGIVPVMAVGDPHQAIYGWRGASATTMRRFVRDFTDDSWGVAVGGLSTSWRNDRAVIDAANVVVAPLRRHSPVPVSSAVPAPSAATGRIHVARLGDERAEAGHVAGWIARRWAGPRTAPGPSAPAGGAVARAGAKAATPAAALTATSAAVLCRRRSQFTSVVAALRAEGLPVEVVGLGGLLTTPEVTDLVAVLTLVADPGRGDAAVRLLTGPAVALGVADLDALAGWARELRAAALAGLGRRSDADVSSDPIGLGEAIDRLPGPGWRGREGERLSPAARGRLTHLANVLDDLRGRRDATLPDLVIAAERAIGLDLEVASRPDRPGESARLNLDAFVDAAAAFEETTERPTLGGFVDWLDAARLEERGLDLPTGSVTDGAVQVLTIHAAKGLEWDVVAIPGMVEGVFPAIPAARSTWSGDQWRVPPARHKGWLTALDQLPFDLRGDRDGLTLLPWRGCPDLAALQRELRDFAEREGARLVDEERRLCYVAVTRARHEVLLTAPVWTRAATPRVTSRFLEDLVESPEVAVAVGPWQDMPGTPAGRPTGTGAGRPEEGLLQGRPAARGATGHLSERVADASEEPTGCVVWPADRQPASDDRLAAAVARVNQLGTASVVELTEGLQEGLLRLLQRRTCAEIADGPRDPLTPPRAYPITHLSVSQLGYLRTDPYGFAEQLRRPMPRPPDPVADRGVTFHTWVERHYRCATLLEEKELPGSGEATLTWSPQAAQAGVPAGTAGMDRAVDAGGWDLSAPQQDVLTASFLRSPWANRRPLMLEVPFETDIAGLCIRGRVDAVFRDSADGVVVLDWKTGRKPRGAAASAHALQLAVYRIAIARLLGIAVDRVRAGCYYAATSDTSYPQLPTEQALFAWLTAQARSASC